MNPTRLRAAIATLVTGAVIVALAPAAHAEKTRVDDGADATASTTDIRTVRVNHGDRRLRVAVRFPDLREDGLAGLMTYFDTDADHRGPEYGLGAPLFSGGDYTLIAMDRWRGYGEPVDCRYNLQLDYDADRLVLTARRGCFEKADELRIAMRMVDHEGEGKAVRDWLIGRREFTDWLTAG